MSRPTMILSLFFFNDTATTEIYTLSLHDALPILPWRYLADWVRGTVRMYTESATRKRTATLNAVTGRSASRSEEHTSELQSPCNLVCRLLLEKKKNQHTTTVKCKVSRQRRVREHA